MPQVEGAGVWGRGGTAGGAKCTGQGVREMQAGRWLLRHGV